MRPPVDLAERFTAGLTFIDELRSNSDGHAAGKRILAYLEPGTLELVSEALPFHLQEGERDRLSILIRPAPAPLDGERQDGEVKSLVASGPWSDSLLTDAAEATRICYRALHRALKGDRCSPQIDIVSGVKPDRAPVAHSTVEAIVPHRGDTEHLRSCIDGLEHQTSSCAATICFDQEGDPSTQSLIAARSRTRFFEVAEPPRGPYVIRQHFASRSRCEFVAFQDSDDFSVASRLSELAQHAHATDADIVGCHELRIDEIEQAVYAIRFPLDVNACLARRTIHAQLFPSTIVRREPFIDKGGLSTDMMFGGDTEYQLRSYFFARNRNVDRFLYIRRRRSGSLTTSPGTKLGSPIRRELFKNWSRDFAAVKKGTLALSNSCLAVRRSSREPSFSRLG